MPDSLPLGSRTLLMGIVNVTPDSFSGDGLALPGRAINEVVEAARRQAAAFLEAGADILDVGAESTRPAAFYGDHPEVDEATELRLAIPVVKALAGAFGDRATVSIDTSKGAVARAALAAGATMVNDVWAGRRDAGTVAAAADAGAYLVLMHNKEVAEYPTDPVAEIVEWLGEAVEAALGAGLPRDRLIVDPGIGFGKTPAHSIEVLRRLAELRRLRLPIMVGTSRKRFIGELLDGAPAGERLEGTLASVVVAIAAGADVVRVHDVREVGRAVRVADALLRPPTGGDRVSLLDMRFDGRHGALPGEQDAPQPFAVDVVMDRDLARAAASDNLDDTVDYAAVFEVVREVMSGPSRNLLETLAEAVAERLLARFAIETVEVRIRKLAVPLPDIGAAEVAIRRRRDL